MRWTDAMILAGAVIAIAPVAYTLFRWAHRGRIEAALFPGGIGRLDSIGDIAVQSAGFGGVALTQLGDASMHISEGTLPANLWLALVSGTLTILVFGVQLGRLLTRWQLRRLRDTDVPSQTAAGD